MQATRKKFTIVTKEGNFMTITDSGQLVVEIPLLEIDRMEYSALLDRYIPIHKRQKFKRVVHSQCSASGDYEVSYEWEAEDEEK